jgi:CheY-like chemotaxis protein
MSGYEVLDRLIAQPQASRPFVIVLTAGIEPRSFDTSLVVGTVHKPFDVELLIDTIAGCLSTLEATTEPVIATSPDALSDTEKAN